MVPQRENSYKGQGQASPVTGTSTVLGDPLEGIEAGDHDEIEAVVVLSDDDTAAAKSVSIQFFTKETSDGADFSSWVAVGAPVVVSYEDTPAGTEAVVRKPATARKHTRDFASKFANWEATITHSEASANSVDAEAVSVGVSKETA